MLYRREYASHVLYLLSVAGLVVSPRPLHVAPPQLLWVRSPPCRCDGQAIVLLGGAVLAVHLCSVRGPICA
jgi:hypothetical protein